MKVVAVIAEYNPLHNGHAYQLSYIRKELQADFIIVLMSGDFVQRGAPAVIDKHTRARMALLSGADLILELPVYYALGSAEYFARGAVSILDALCTVDYLHFGSECGDVDKLWEIAKVLADEPPLFREKVSQYLKEGLSYPKARIRAYCEFSKENGENVLCEEEISDILSSPNNILGIEYCKAIIQMGSRIKPVTLKREGAGYHENVLSNEQKYPSASALRMLAGERFELTEWKPYLPPAAYEALSEINPVCVEADDISAMLQYKLLLEEQKGYAEYLDVSQDLSDKIKKNRKEFTTFSDFCMLLKAKNYTYTRVCRCMLHILLNIQTNELKMLTKQTFAHYVRILGFRMEAVRLLNQLKKNTQIPIIAKLADADRQLEGDSLKMLKKDIFASSVYQCILSSKSGKAEKTEYQREIIRV